MAMTKKVVIKDEERCCEVDGKLNLPTSVRENLDRAGGLDSLADDLPALAELEERSKIHQALSDPARLRLLEALNRCDLCPCVLKAITGQSDSKLSYHLEVLEEIGLVRSAPEKKWRIYSITELGRRMLDPER
jgi:ArsR family transcriptional regulator